MTDELRRQCTDCGEWKWLSAFPKGGTQSMRFVCRVCRGWREVAYRLERKEKYLRSRYVSVRNRLVAIKKEREALQRRRLAS